MPDPATHVFPAFEGPHLTVFGMPHWILSDGSDNGGAFSVVAAECGPGCLIPPHRHPTTGELFMLHTGTYEFWVDGRWQRVETPRVIHCPAGADHGFRNVGETTGRMVAVYTPAGFEQLLTELDGLTMETEGLAETLHALNEKYQVTDVDPSIWQDA